MEVGWEDRPLKAGGSGQETRDSVIKNRKENTNCQSSASCGHWQVPGSVSGYLWLTQRDGRKKDGWMHCMVCWHPLGLEVSGRTGPCNCLLQGHG